MSKVCRMASFLSPAVAHRQRRSNLRSSRSSPRSWAPPELVNSSPPLPNEARCGSGGFDVPLGVLIPLPLGELRPEVEALVVKERVLEALDPHGTLQARLLGIAGALVNLHRDG